MDGAWVPALDCWEFGSPACPQCGLMLQNLPVLCVCVFVCPTICLYKHWGVWEHFQSESVVLEVLLSPVMSQCGLKWTAQTSSQQYVALESRMRRYFLCLRKNCIWSPSDNAWWPSFTAACSSMKRSQSRCHRPAMEKHISMHICRCKTPPSEENILLGMASPGSPLVILRSWMVHKMLAMIYYAGSLSSLRIKLASSSWDQKGAWPVCPIKS